MLMTVQSKENVCRPVYFCLFDGKMKWKVGAEEFEHSFGEYLTPDQVSKRLKTAIDAKGNWVRDVISAADQKLTEIRRYSSNCRSYDICSNSKARQRNSIGS